MTTAPPDPAGRVGAWTTPVIAVFYMVAAYLHLVYLQPNLDSAWLLVAVDRMLDGGNYLNDFLEVNPPWVLLVFAPAGLAARLTGADSYTFLILLIYLYVAITLALTRQVTERFFPRGSAVRSWLPVTAAFFFLIYPAYDFGQRDYLACVFALPWLALHGAVPLRERLPPRLSAGLAAWATLGLFMKPPLLVLPVLLAVARSAFQRSVRPVFAPDMIAFGLLGLGYIAIVLLRFPDYLVVAGILWDTYESYNLPLDIVVIKTAPYAVVSVFPAVLAHYAAASDDERRTIGVFMAMVLAGVLSVLLQHKGWWYHRLPIVVFGGISGVLAVTMAARWIDSGRSRPRVLFPVFSALAVGAVLIAVVPLEGLMTKNRAGAMGSPLYVRLAALAPKTPVYVFAGSVDKAFPLVPMVGAAWASRLPSHWPVAGYVFAAEEGALPAGRIAELEALARRIVHEDFKRYRPEIVLVDRHERKQAFAIRFEFLDFLLASPEFTEIWRNYTFLENLNEFDIYVRAARPIGAGPAGPRIAPALRSTAFGRLATSPVPTAFGHSQGEMNRVEE